MSNKQKPNNNQLEGAKLLTTANPLRTAKEIKSIASSLFNTMTRQYRSDRKKLSISFQTFVVNVAGFNQDVNPFGDDRQLTPLRRFENINQSSFLTLHPYAFFDHHSCIE